MIPLITVIIAWIISYVILSFNSLNILRYTYLIPTYDICVYISHEPWLLHLQPISKDIAFQYVYYNCADLTAGKFNGKSRVRSVILIQEY